MKTRSRGQIMKRLVLTGFSDCRENPEEERYFNITTDKETQFTVFIIDDNQLFLEALHRRLENTVGANVLVFTTGEDCLKNLHLSPDLILSDYFLDADYSNKMNGDKLLARIKKEAPDIPVIIYSSQESIDLAVTLIRQGASECLSKDGNAVKRIPEIVHRKLMELKKKNKQKERRKLLYIFLLLITAFILSMLAIKYVMGSNLFDSSSGPEIIPGGIAGILMLPTINLIMRELKHLVLICRKLLKKITGPIQSQ